MKVKTMHTNGAGTDADVSLIMYGDSGTSGNANKFIEIIVSKINYMMDFSST